MSIYKQFETDKQRQAQGTPIEMSPNEDGTKPIFFVAHASKANEEWARSFERHSRPYKAQIRLKTMEQRDWEEISRQVFLDAILKGWTDVQDREGKLIEYNRKNAEKLMAELPALYQQLEEESNNLENFKATVQEEDVKN